MKYKLEVTKWKDTSTWIVRVFSPCTRCNSGEWVQRTFNFGKTEKEARDTGNRLIELMEE